MPGSRPLPTRRARVRASSADVNRSRIGSSTMTREVAVQRWPVEKNAALTTIVTASSTSASASTTVGFFPPISSWTRARRFAASTAMRLPVASDPVNEMARTWAFVTISLPTRLPGPVTRLMAPFVTPGLVERLDHPQRAERRDVGRLQHDRVAADERRRRLPRGNGDREVPGRDEADDPERPPHRVDEHAVALRRHRLARQPRALAGEVAQDVHRAPHFAARLRERLPLLARHVARDRLRPRLEDVGCPVQESRRASAPGWRPTPAAPRAPRRSPRAPRLRRTSGTGRRPRRCSPGSASRRSRPTGRRPTHRR
jgi:hypothetical protein